MRRIDKIYRDKPSTEELARIMGRNGSISMSALNGYSNDWENSLINIDKVLEEEENGTIC